MTAAATLAQLASSGALTADSSGNVGIGTSSPAGKLDVAGSGGRFYVGSAGDAIQFTNGGSNYIGANTAGGQLVLQTVGQNRVVIDSSGNLQFNSGYGSAATAYGCRAWVNFNGTGTVAIRASGNVSSITDNGTGDYTVNFTTAMPNTNYVLAGAVFWEAGIPSGLIGVGGTVPATGSCKLITLTNATDVGRDFTQVYAMYLR